MHHLDPDLKVGLLVTFDESRPEIKFTNGSYLFQFKGHVAEIIEIEAIDSTTAWIKVWWPALCRYGIGINDANVSTQAKWFKKLKET